MDELNKRIGSNTCKHDTPDDLFSIFDIANVECAIYSDSIP